MSLSWSTFFSSPPKPSEIAMASLVISCAIATCSAHYLESIEHPLLVFALCGLMTGGSLVARGYYQAEVVEETPNRSVFIPMLLNEDTVPKPS